MRLNMDGLSDVVVLKSAQTEPVVLHTQPATTFTVTTTADNGDNANPTQGSLRLAIENANTNLGADFIIFNIPLSDSGCNQTTAVCTIRPPSTLPEFLETSTIRGAEVVGLDGTLLVSPVLDGGFLPLPEPGQPNEQNGLNLDADCLAIYLEFRNFGNTAVEAAAPNDSIEASYFAFNERAIVFTGFNGRVGGTVASASVSIVNNDKGVSFEGDGGTSQGNKYGVDRGGNAGSNVIDLFIAGQVIQFSSSEGENAKNSPGEIFTASNNIVGGTQPGAGNVIANSVFDGIQIFPLMATGNLVQGNPEFLFLEIPSSATSAWGFPPAAQKPPPR